MQVDNSEHFQLIASDSKQKQTKWPKEEKETKKETVGLKNWGEQKQNGTLSINKKTVFIRQLAVSWVLPSSDSS